MLEASQLAVDPASPRPPFEQVRTRIADAIANGSAPAETRLPPIRQLASAIGLAANTVARAYRELEAAGLVETRGRNGTFVVGTPSESRREALELTRAHVDRMRELGMTPTVTLAMLRRALDTEGSAALTAPPDDSASRR